MGIKLADGSYREFDVIAIATGLVSRLSMFHFLAILALINMLAQDITTGDTTNMGLVSIHNSTRHDEWKSTAQTYLGTKAEVMLTSSTRTALMARPYG